MLEAQRLWFIKEIYDAVIEADVSIRLMRFTSAATEAWLCRINYLITDSRDAHNLRQKAFPGAVEHKNLSLTNFHLYHTGMECRSFGRSSKKKGTNSLHMTTITK